MGKTNQAPGKPTQSKETPDTRTGKKKQAPGKTDQANLASIPKPTEAEQASRDALVVADRDQMEQAHRNPPPSWGIENYLKNQA
jgi:hypothetical protein